MTGYLRWCGAPDEHIGQLTDGGRRSANAAMARSAMVRADRLIAHGDLVDVPGLRLRAVWTPGHSPGHLCFHDETHGLLLTGDHVLPRITPNISAWDLESEPLAAYLDSLEELRALEPSEVLPAHEYRFAGLGSQARRAAGAPPGAAARGGGHRGVRPRQAHRLAGRQAGDVVAAVGPAVHLPAPGGARRGGRAPAAPASAARRQLRPGERRRAVAAAELA